MTRLGSFEKNFSFIFNNYQLHLLKKSQVPYTKNRSSFWSHTTMKSSCQKSCSMEQGSDYSRDLSRATESSQNSNIFQKVKLKREEVQALKMRDSSSKRKLVRICEIYLKNSFSSSLQLSHSLSHFYNRKIFQKEIGPRYFGCYLDY